MRGRYLNRLGVLRTGFCLLRTIPRDVGTQILSQARNTRCCSLNLNNKQNLISCSFSPSPVCRSSVVGSRPAAQAAPPQVASPYPAAVAVPGNDVHFQFSPGPPQYPPSHQNVPASQYPPSHQTMPYNPEQPPAQSVPPTAFPLCSVAVPTKSPVAPQVALRSSTAWLCGRVTPRVALERVLAMGGRPMYARPCPRCVGAGGYGARFKYLPLCGLCVCVALPGGLPPQNPRCFQDRNCSQLRRTGIVARVRSRMKRAQQSASCVTPRSHTGSV